MRHQIKLHIPRKPQILLCCFCLSAFLAGSLAAQSAEDNNLIGMPASMDTDQKKPVAVEELIRDPFWPVGYRPPVKKNEEEVLGGEGGDAGGRETDRQAFEAARAAAFAMLKVGGIINRGKSFFASVNGQMVRSGDVIVVPWEEYVFRFRIKQINSRRVQIIPVD